MHALPLTLALLAFSAAARPAASPLPFIEDDYPRALAEAKAKKLPLFVDVWAPW